MTAKEIIQIWKSPLLYNIKISFSVQFLSNIIQNNKPDLGNIFQKTQVINILDNFGLLNTVEQ